MSYQFRRGLGETQEGGGAVSECFQAASRMVPGDQESWHVEWLSVAERNDRRGDAEAAVGHIQTAQNCWLRAANYYRQAEFWLASRAIPRRLPTFEAMEACSKKFHPPSEPPGEVGRSPLRERRIGLCAYFVRAPFAVATPAGADLHGRARQHQGRDVVHAGARGAAARHLRADDRRAGAGGHAAAAQGQHAHRLRSADRSLHRLPGDARPTSTRAASPSAALASAAITPPAPPAMSTGSPPASRTARSGASRHLLGRRGEDHGLAEHIKWVFGARSMAEALMKSAALHAGRCAREHALPLSDRPWRLRRSRRRAASRVYEYAKAKGVDVTLRFLSGDGNGRRPLPARQPDHRPGDDGRLAGRPFRHRRAPPAPVGAGIRTKR